MSNAVRYRRDSSGGTVHRADCSRAKNGIPWNLADDKNADELLALLAPHPWLKPCRVCKPLTSPLLVDPREEAKK